MKIGESFVTVMGSVSGWMWVVMRMVKDRHKFIVAMSADTYFRMVRGDHL